MLSFLTSNIARRPSSANSRHSTTTRKVVRLAVVLPFIGFAAAQSGSDTIAPRWGQASALVGSLFVVQGGKTQDTTGGGYTYSSAPSDGQMYALDLSSSFSLSSPPWQALSPRDAGLAAPAVAFHTISPINSTALLLFGGDGSLTVPVQTNNDSAYIVSLGATSSGHTVSYQAAPAAWNQPMRRVYHTSEVASDGTVMIVGGEKADGSGLILDQQWSIDPTSSSPSFQLASTSPPGSLVGATSTMLSDGTLLMLGGADASGQLQSMQTIYAYSTKTKTWAQTNTSATISPGTSAAAFPASRRDHVAVSLPDHRVFIQGGSSEDLSTVYSDAWILDWSVNPPVWTEVDTTSGPGPRFGHSAVAYGREVLISFGWAGGNAAPSGLHVFDATTLTTTSQGNWTGGSWSTSTYTPDPQAAQPAAQSQSGSHSGSTSSGSNGSSSSSGGSASTSSDPNAGNNGGDTGSGASFPTSGAAGNSGSGSANGNNSSGSGTTAGATIGAIIGAGLVVGAGYAVYRRRSLNNYRRYGDASFGLLGFGGRRGPPDDDILMEKGYVRSDYDRPYHQAEPSAPLTGGLTFGRKRGHGEGAAWAAGNLGHAMEGSGPHFRERIAIFAGRGKRDTVFAPRVDMLADEGDGNSLYRPVGAERASHLYADGEMEAWDDSHVRERSYIPSGDEDLSMGDLGRLHHKQEDGIDFDMCSPFEDRPEHFGSRPSMFTAAGAGGYGQLADREHDGYDDEHQSEGRSEVGTQEGAPTDPSVQSHSGASKSDAPSSDKSWDVLSVTGGIVSFSDASHKRNNSQSGMKRSPTWWDRFMGNSLLERTASGRFFSGPNASLPIRDPAPPPVSGLAVIEESSRSRNVSTAQDPFMDPAMPVADGVGAGLDEMGRRVDGEGDLFMSGQHGRSVSSIGSARTGASSHFESRLQGMDVIQRARTGSSRRTQSIRTGSSMSDTDSEPALSRGPTLLRPRNMTSSEALEANVDTKTEDDEHFRRCGEPSSGLADLAEEELGDDGPPESPSAPAPWFSKPNKDSVRRSNASETPSITPLTTKRARLNPVMVSPLFPSAASSRLGAPQPAAQLSASVRDKIKAFEESTTTSPITPESAWTASLSSAKSRVMDGNTDKGREAMVRSTSMASSTANSTTTNNTTRTSTSASKAQKYGLVPKAQLFVANPDHHAKGSSASSS